MYIAHMHSALYYVTFWLYCITMGGQLRWAFVPF